MVGVDGVQQAFRAGSDLQDDVEALTRLDRARVDEPPAQTLKARNAGRIAVISAFPTPIALNSTSECTRPTNTSSKRPRSTPTLSP